MGCRSRGRMIRRSGCSRGEPEVATEPLQVAVGRLVGFRWPEQRTDDLDDLADDDGIVCLPSVAGEQPAAERVRAAVGGGVWGRVVAGAVDELLEAVGVGEEDLGGWLRDDFFKHHCKVFGNRPFVWHIWDGRRMGSRRW